ncbi:MAG: polysaccharide biosynthesis/export family protein [Pedobacter sp.]|nr:polysaccharide biosynthesis/export family protein [Chitinophagaceae bacterium]
MLKIIKSYKKLMLLVCFASIVLLSSCVDQKKFTYFNDIPLDSSHLSLSAIPFPKTVVQKDDILEIKISGRNDLTAIDFNAKGSGFGNGQAVIPTYLVDRNGEIEFYLAGKLKVTDMTVEEIKEKILPMVAKYLLDPVVNVRLVNFRFTVLGEVRNPNTYSIANEKITILEALGYAGDMTYYSKRNNVKIIRDSSGFREIGVLDFGSKKILNSPYYFLKRNDVIYVETNTKYRQTGETYSRASLIVGILSGLLALSIYFTR